MTYDISLILEGLASILDELGYKIYISNRQQAVKTPCFFISLMPGTTTEEVDGRIMLDLGLDIVFLQQANSLNTMDNVYTVLTFLDENLALVPYTVPAEDPEEDPETTLLHTYDRSYHMEQTELHYQLHFKNRVHVPENHELMASLEVDYEIKTKN
jgi:hypothetical protein